jgi:TolB protein
MRALAWVALVVAGAAATGSAAAPVRTAATPHTLLATKSVITQFAQDGNWIGWTTARRDCNRRLHLLSLRTRREAQIEQPNYRIGCTDGMLALASGRAAWPAVVGHGNTEVDYAIVTASAGSPKPRVVRKMFLLRDDYEPEPPLPVLAGRGSVLAYFRNDDGLGEPSVHAVERVVDGKAIRVFKTPDAAYLAVDRGRIAAVRREVLRGDACNCNFDPVWSPDGKRVAYVSGRQCCDSEEEKADIYVIDSYGTIDSRARVTTDERPKLGVAWSPDGTRLAFGYYTTSFVPRIAVVNVDGTGRHDIATGRYPAWSPDGTRLAFDNGQNAVVVADADGSNARQVARGSEPQWSPDGTRLVFTNGRALSTSRIDGSDQRAISAGLSSPVWSPDGSKIAAAARNGIVILNADGSGRALLRGTVRADGHPSWSPDGSRILFDSLRNDLDGDYYAEPEVYVTNADGTGAAVPVTHGIDDELVARLEIRSIYGRLLSIAQLGGAPLGLALDGRYAAVLTQPARTGQKHLQVVNAGTGEVIRSILVPDSAVAPLSAHRGRVVFAAGHTIRIADLRSGDARLLAFARGRIVGVVISGRRVTWAENIGRSGRIRTVLLPR